MTISLQVLYPVTTDTSFDHDYYLSSHMPLVGRIMGPNITKTQVTRGVAGGPDVPAGFYAIATMVFADRTGLDAAVAAAGPVLDDIPNYYNGLPQMLIGEVVL